MTCGAGAPCFCFNSNDDTGENDYSPWDDDEDVADPLRANR